jgi:hypothetical protein
MDTETQTQLNEQLQQMSDLLSQQNSAMSAQIKVMNDVISATGSQSSATKKVTSAENDVIKNTNTSNKKVESAGKAMDMVKEANERFATSLDKGKSAISGFAVAMTDVTPGMAKYAASLKEATLAVATMASGFGPLGKATEGILGVFASLVASATKYNDAVVQGYDDVAKLGAGIGTSAEDIVKLGHNAGLSSQNLSLLTKNAASLGMNIRSLGTTTSKGLDTFGKMIAVGDNTLEQYRKLGFSQEDLIEAQTAYIDIQTQAGADLKKSPEELQKASLAYIDNLNVMAEMTGVSVKQQQDAQKQALAQENFDVYMSGLQAKKMEALKAGNKAEADRLQKVYDAKLELATQAKANLDPKQAQGVLEGISTNGKTIMSKEVAKLEMSGIHINQMNDELNKGNKQTGRLLGENAQAVENYRKRFGDLGTAAGDASIGMMNAFNLGTKSFESGNKFYDLRTKEGQEAWQKQYDATVAKQKKDKESHDKLLDQRAVQEKNERQARLAFDDLLSKLSAMFTKVVLKAMPIMLSVLTFISNHFDTIVTVTKTLGIALAALAAAMVGAKVVNFFRSFTDNMKGIFLGKQKLGSSATKPMYVRMAGSGPGKAVASGSGAIGKIVGKSASAGNLLHEAEEATGKKGNGNGMFGKAEQGMSGLSKLANQPGASSVGTFLGGLSKGLGGVGKALPEFALGSAAVAAAIVAVGAAIAAAGWIAGKAMPTLAEGLQSFDPVDGKNLKDVGIGMAGLGAGILAMGGAKISDALGNLASWFSGNKKDPLDSLGEELTKFQSLKIDKEKVKYNSEAFVYFSKAFAQASAIQSLGTITAGIANGVSGFFSKEPPFEKFVNFSHLKINPQQTKQNATAFKYFSEAMSAYKGNGPLGALGSIATSLADGASKFFGVKPPIDQFNYFSHLPINPKKAKANAAAFTDFANALSEYKGGPGIGDAISSLAGGVLNSFLGKDGPIDAFDKFTKMNFGPNMDKNSDAFEKYANSVTKVSNNGSSGGGGGGGGGGGNQQGGFMSSVSAGMNTGASVGAGAVGVVEGAIGATASGIGSAVSSAWKYLTGTGAEKGVKPEVLGRKQQLEKILGRKLIVTSGVRPGVANHGDGSAIDIGLNTNHLSEDDKVKMITNAIGMGFTGIGAEYAASGGAHIHLDTSHKVLTAWGSDYHAESLKKDAPWLINYISSIKSGKKPGNEHGGPPTIGGDTGKMISSIKKDSVIAKLGKKTSTTKTTKKKESHEKEIMENFQQGNSLDTAYTKNMVLNAQIANKLDQVIGILESDHDTQHKILREVRI